MPKVSNEYTPVKIWPLSGVSHLETSPTRQKPRRQRLMFSARFCAGVKKMGLLFSIRFFCVDEHPAVPALWGSFPNDSKVRANASRHIVIATSTKPCQVFVNVGG